MFCSMGEKPQWDVVSFEIFEFGRWRNRRKIKQETVRCHNGMLVAGINIWWTHSNTRCSNWAEFSPFKNVDDQNLANSAMWIQLTVTDISQPSPLVMWIHLFTKATTFMRTNSTECVKTVFFSPQWPHHNIQYLHDLFTCLYLPRDTGTYPQSPQLLAKTNDFCPAVANFHFFAHCCPIALPFPYCPNRAVPTHYQHFWIILTPLCLWTPPAPTPTYQYHAMPPPSTNDSFTHHHPSSPPPTYTLFPSSSS